MRPVTSQTETDTDRMKIVFLGILVAGGMLASGNNYNGKVYCLIRYLGGLIPSLD